MWQMFRYAALNHTKVFLHYKYYIGIYWIVKSRQYITSIVFQKLCLKVMLARSRRQISLRNSINHRIKHLHKLKILWWLHYFFLLSYNFLSWQTLEIEKWTNSSHSSELLRYHIVSCEELRESDLKSVKEVVTSSGYKLRFSVRDVSHILYFQYWIFIWTRVKKLKG